MITTEELARIRAAAVGDMLGDPGALDEIGLAATVFRLCWELERLAREADWLRQSSMRSPAHAESSILTEEAHLEENMPEKISRFAILVRDMRAAQKRYFDTRDKADLSRAKELERKVDDELAVIFGGVRTQGSLL